MEHHDHEYLDAQHTETSYYYPERPISLKTNPHTSYYYPKPTESIKYINTSDPRTITFGDCPEKPVHSKRTTMHNLNTAETTGNSRRIRQIKNLKAMPIITADNQQNHLAQAGECFRDLYSHDRLTDVIIFIDDVKFSVHKAILMTHSEYFKEVLDVTDANLRTEIELTGIPSAAFESVLEFMYTSDVYLSMEIVANIHTAADQLEINILRDKCDKLIENLKPSDACIILYTGYKKDSQICMLAFSIVVHTFYEIVNTPGITAQNAEVFIWIMACDDLVIDSEMDVFRTCMNWLRRDFTDRQEYTNRVLSQVRYCYLTPYELLICTEMMEDIEKDINDLLQESMWYAVAAMYQRAPNIPVCLNLPPRRPNRETPNDDDDSVDGREPELGERTILMLGGLGPDDSVCVKATGKSIYAFTPHDLTLRLVGQMPEPRHLHCAVITKDCIYILGGACPLHNFGKYPTSTSTVYKWDLVRKQWEDCAKMRHSRVHHSAVTLKNKIYVIAGQSGNGKILSSMERYNPCRNRWVEREPLRVGRIGLAAAVHKGKIMVAGGYRDTCNNHSGEPIMGSFEMYYPKTNSWTSLQSLFPPRCHSIMVKVGKQLYICGGAYRSEENKGAGYDSLLTSVSNIDKYNDRKRKWQKFATLKYSRHGARAAAIGSKLYILGGVSTIARSAVDKVECLDTKTGITRVTNLGCPAQTGMGVVVCDSVLIGNHFMS